MSTSALYGAIEAGGTKFVCLVGQDPAHILAEDRFSTSLPGETLARVAGFFTPFCRTHHIRAVGIGSFGPCDLDASSPTYGHITTTPKPGWENTDIVGTLTNALRVPIAFDTDVNAAAFGEHRWGAAVGMPSCLYITVGTGIGGGCVVDGRPLHGLQHPEMGHIRVPHDRSHDSFPGACPYHGDCLEGLVSGPAIERRFGVRGEALEDADAFWELEAEYLAAALANYILTLSPSRIIMGGGIMQRAFLLPRIRAHVQGLLAGYVRHTALSAGIDGYIVSPGLGTRSGVLGALALAAATVARGESGFHS